MTVQINFRNKGQLEYYSSTLSDILCWIEGFNSAIKKKNKMLIAIHHDLEQLNIIFKDEIQRQRGEE